MNILRREPTSSYSDCNYVLVQVPASHYDSCPLNLTFVAFRVYSKLKVDKRQETKLKAQPTKWILELAWIKLMTDQTPHAIVTTALGHHSNHACRKRRWTIRVEILEETKTRAASGRPTDEVVGWHQHFSSKRHSLSLLGSRLQHDEIWTLSTAIMVWMMKTYCSVKDFHPRPWYRVVNLNLAE